MNTIFFKRCLLIILLTMICLSTATGDNGKHKGWDKKKNQAHKHQTTSSSEHVLHDNGAPIMAHRCPFSCAILRIPKDHCRDWREGSTCLVQDLHAKSVQYRILEQPTTSRRYYVIEVPELLPSRSPGAVVGESIDRAIDSALR